VDGTRIVPDSFASLEVSPSVSALDITRYRDRADGFFRGMSIRVDLDPQNFLSLEIHILKVDQLKSVSCCSTASPSSSLYREDIPS